MSAPARIETVREDDLNDVLPLMRAYCEFYDVAPPDAGLLEIARALAADPGGEGFQLIARDWRGRAVGFATVFWTWSTLQGGRVGVLNDLYVAEHARGSGLARALIAECLGRCERRGASALRWQTAPDNERARRLYDALGAQRSQWIDYALRIPA